ncbi:MAG: cyclic-phosphate processing receiver domain-containing protein [Gillisia sp.]
MKKLFLDEIRNPDWIYDQIEANDFVVVRNHNEFIDYIKLNGLPDFISFDNDLGMDEKGKLNLMAMLWRNDWFMNRAWI